MSLETSSSNGMQTRSRRNGTEAGMVSQTHVACASCRQASGRGPGQGCGGVDGCGSEEEREVR